MSTCPHGAHIDHETRIGRCEDDIKTIKEAQVAMKEKIGSPAVAVAVISFFGVCVTSVASFAAVVLSPVLTAMLKSWGWL